MREKNHHNLIKEEMGQSFFTAVQYAFFKDGEQYEEYHDGFLTEKKEEKVSGDTMFDLASLTKALFTVPVFYYLFEKRIAYPEDLIGKYLPEITRKVSIFDLLSHKSGFPAYMEFFDQDSIDSYAERKESAIYIVDGITENHPPVYSDINYILLGFVLESLFKKRIDKIWDLFLDEIKYPHKNIVFAPTMLDRSATAATGYSKIRSSVCHGEVEDENCAYFGNIAGHAGLFGSAVEVGRYLSHIMNQGWFKWHVKKGAGFDRPEGDNSNYGKKAVPEMLGHLGFTGTSFLINLKENRAGVILTNRTHPDVNKNNWKERIKKVRQAVFDENFYPE